MPAESIVRNIALFPYKEVFECIKDLGKYDILILILYADEGKKSY